MTDPAPVENAFRFNDGSSARSLEEFHARLGALSLDLVGYHRDHFEAWVREVIRDEPLALRIGDYARARPEPATFRDIVADLVSGRLEQWRAWTASSANR